MKRMACFVLGWIVLTSSPTLAAERDDAFFALIASGDAAGVRAAIAGGQPVNIRNRAGKTPLLYATSFIARAARRDNFYRDVVVSGDRFESGSPQVVSADCTILSLLIAAGADVDAGSPAGFTALHQAARSSPDAVKILLAASANVNARDESGATPLFTAALLHPSYDPALKLECVSLLLLAGADVNARNRQGQTALLFVGPLSQGNFPLAASALAERLVRAGADVNARDSQGSSPLLNWVAGPPGPVKILLNAGADPNAHDHLGMAPLLAAAMFNGTQGSDRVLKLLADAGADPNVRANDGVTPLWIAAMRGREKDVAVLLAAGADVDVRMEGMTPLHAATGIIGMETRENSGTFEERVRRGASIFKSGMQPEAGVNFPGVAKLLVEAGADINATSTKTTFYGLPDPSQAASLRLFVGKTPLDFAKILGNEAMTQYLRSLGAKSAGKWYWPF